MFSRKTNSLETDAGKIGKALSRRLEADGVYPSQEEVISRLRLKSHRVYLGIDPTGPEIHLGHTIPLLFLRQLWLLGHKPVIVIGDFTARIGDPSGKTVSRKPLTKKEIDGNMRTYLSQIYKILPKGSFEVRYNSSWLSRLTFEELLRLSALVTVQQMIKRDMFQERLKNDQPVGLHEFMYPLMQGYDSVAMDIDGEVGGNDQTFNMLMGRDLMQKILNKDKLVFATRLLVNAEGKKMSKTEGGLIAIADSPGDMFGKTMASVPDDLIGIVFELCTDKDPAWIKDNSDNIKSDPYAYKKMLGRELVAMYHGPAAAEKAAAESEKVFSRGELPAEMQELSGSGISVLDFVVKYNLAESRSEAKRLVEQKAVRVNSEAVESWDRVLAAGDIVQVGPRKFAKVI